MRLPRVFWREVQRKKQGTAIAVPVFDARSTRTGHTVMGPFQRARRFEHAVKQAALLIWSFVGHGDAVSISGRSCDNRTSALVTTHKTWMGEVSVQRVHEVFQRVECTTIPDHVLREAPRACLPLVNEGREFRLRPTVLMTQAQPYQAVALHDVEAAYTDLGCAAPFCQSRHSCAAAVRAKGPAVVPALEARLCQTACRQWILPMRASVLQRDKLARRQTCQDHRLVHHRHRQRFRGNATTFGCDKPALLQS